MLYRIDTVFKDTSSWQNNTKHMCWFFGLYRRAALKCEISLKQQQDSRKHVVDVVGMWLQRTAIRTFTAARACSMLPKKARGTAGTSWHCLIKHLDESDKDSFTNPEVNKTRDHKITIHLFFKIHFCWPSWPSTFYITFVSAWEFHFGIFTLCHRTFGNLSRTLEVSSPWFGDLAETVEWGYLGLTFQLFLIGKEVVFGWEISCQVWEEFGMIITQGLSFFFLPGILTHSSVRCQVAIDALGCNALHGAAAKGSMCRCVDCRCQKRFKNMDHLMKYVPGMIQVWRLAF